MAEETKAETAWMVPEKATGAGDAPSTKEKATHAEGESWLSPVTWRALPTLGEGLARVGLAGGLGIVTGIVWGGGGRQPPSGFLAALGWALTLGATGIVASMASVALERRLRGVALRRALPDAGLALLALLTLLLVMAICVTVLPETFTLGIPVLFSLTLGLAAGFAAGGMRLWRMSRDALWLFVAIGVACLFGVTLTFILPAVLAPSANGALGFYGCLIYAVGLPGVAAGSVAGGALRMRVEEAAYGVVPESGSSEGAE